MGSPACSDWCSCGAHTSWSRNRRKMRGSSVLVRMSATCSCVLIHCRAICSARNGLSSLLRLVQLWRAYELVAESQEDARQQRLGEDVGDLLLRADPLQGDLQRTQWALQPAPTGAAVARIRVGRGIAGRCAAAASW